jgi:hypothetical protein
VYLKMTKWQSRAWDQAWMPTSGGGGMGSRESFVLRRERVLVKTLPSTFLPGPLEIISADGGAVESGPYSSSRRVDAGEGSRRTSAPFSFIFSSIVVFLLGLAW